MSRRLLINLSRNYATRPASSPKQSSLSKIVVDEFANYMPKVVKNGLARATFIETSDVAARLQETRGESKHTVHLMLSDNSVHRHSQHPEMCYQLWDKIIPIEKIAEYCTAGRKPVQGQFMAFTYEFLTQSKVNENLLHQIQVLATTIELIQTYYFFWDDLEDGATERCGQQCWHLRPGVGLLAINDACLLRSLITEIIEQNFDGEIRKNILHVYNRTYFVSSMGQFYDTEVTKKKNYEKFTLEVYERITRSKSAPFSVLCPTLTALALANKLTPESSKNIIDIFNGLGLLVQAHNDMVDFCINKGAVVGQSGTDIQEGKCSWPAVTVLQKCSPSDKQIFQENYGSWDPTKVERIHELYDKFDLLNLYIEELEQRREVYFSKVNALPEHSEPSADYYTDFYNLFNNYIKDLRPMYNQH